MLSDFNPLFLFAFFVCVSTSLWHLAIWGRGAGNRGGKASESSRGSPQLLTHRVTLGYLSQGQGKVVAPEASSHTVSHAPLCSPCLLPVNLFHTRVQEVPGPVSVSESCKHIPRLA